MKKYLFFLMPAMLFTLFIMLAKYEDRAMLRTIDFAVTVKIQDAIDRSSRLRLRVITEHMLEGSVFFAGPIVSSVATVALFIVAFRKRKWRALSIPLCFALIVVGELVAKELVHHPPPPYFMIKNPSSIFPKYHVSEEFSFPSGHAARAIYVALLMYPCIRKQWYLVGGLITYVGLVSISKIYLGHHWFSDVIGGILLGGAFGQLSLRKK